jgi:hypothetical protein
MAILRATFAKVCRPAVMTAAKSAVKGKGDVITGVATQALAGMGLYKMVLGSGEGPSLGGRAKVLKPTGSSLSERIVVSYSKVPRNAFLHGRFY